FRKDQLTQGSRKAPMSHNVSRRHALHLPTPWRTDRVRRQQEALCPEPAPWTPWTPWRPLHPTEVSALSMAPTTTYPPAQPAYNWPRRPYDPLHLPPIHLSNHRLQAR